jgi:hypothetical protein
MATALEIHLQILPHYLYRGSFETVQSLQVEQWYQANSLKTALCKMHIIIHKYEVRTGIAYLW